jgi:hypothetical protein
LSAALENGLTRLDVVACADRQHQDGVATVRLAGRRGDAPAMYLAKVPDAITTLSSGST